MKVKLIDDVRGSWKLLSVWVAAAWSAFGAWVLSDPTLLITAWLNIPEDLRAMLPPWIRGPVAGLIVFATIYAARVVKQPVRKGGAP